ncbi:hypothetical protein [Brevundimonas sp. SORGH_AS_0993]|uniref:hypothetical protein n=1 Tax=Brevundimonas sp. SORGH_AS_0993 TaxID=3041794 RepID=UPI0027D866B4|nr:hypothetical protein [Brevundimonas sp. SORGH_AS_0993]
MVPSIPTVLAVVLSGAPPQAQADAPPVVVLDDVEVSARRGGALAAPERAYDPAAIDALAAQDIAEVVGRVSERLGEREPPVLVINGRKVADPSIFTRFPPEALARLEVLPRGAAGLYGEDTGRRVLNLVLERRFKTTTGQVEAGGPTDPGSLRLQAQGRYAALADQSALTAGIDVSSTTALRVREREGYTLRTPGDDLVTLLPGARGAALNLAAIRPVGAWSSSFRADLRQAETTSVTVLNQDVVRYGARTNTVAAALGLSGEVGGWNTQLMLKLDVAASRQTGLSETRQTLRSIDASGSASRILLTLPGGDLRANLTLSATEAGRSGEGGSSEPAGAAGTETWTARMTGGVTIPLTRRIAPEEEGPFGLGETSLSLGGAVGGGQALNAALAWSPLDRLRFEARLKTDRQPPSVQQRYAPVVYGEPVTVFDLARGEAVQVVPIRGGDPALRDVETRSVILELSAGPYMASGVLLGLVYDQTTGEDGVTVLTTPTPALEAAYPDRFIRDAEGRLTMIDQRPCNLSASDTRTLTLNLNAALPLATDAAGETQWIGLNLNAVRRLRDRADLGDGMTRIDTLAGGGQPRWEGALFLDTSRGRWIGSVSAKWRSAYRLRLAQGDAPGDILIRGLTTFSLRGAFTLSSRRAQDSEQAGRRAGGGQIVLEIENLFDARPGARRADGRPVPGYGRDDRDPLGRTVRVQLSRRF